MAFVQGKQYLSSTIGNTGTMTFASNVTAGNHIVILFDWDYAGCQPSFTDGLGNTYTLKSTLTVSGARRYYVFTAPITTGGACTITCSAGCSQGGGGIFEISGLQTDPFDQANFKVNSTSTLNTNSITPSTDGQFILALFSRLGVVTSYAAGSGFTLGSAGLTSAADEYQVQGTAGAINPDMTPSSSQTDYAAFPVTGLVASFKATAAAATQNSNFLMFMGPQPQQ